MRVVRMMRVVVMRAIGYGTRCIDYFADDGFAVVFCFAWPAHFEGVVVVVDGFGGWGNLL